MRFALLCFLLAVSATAPAHGLTIAAASSLRQAMPELEEAFAEQEPGTRLRIVYGASGKLATQILNGAPYDLFLSADTTYPRKLEARGAVASGPDVYAIGRLALWHADPQREALSPADLASDSVRHIAIAQPRHAPYGQRARQALEALELWHTVEPKLVYGENIGQTAAMVASGAAEAGLIAWSLTFAPELAGRPFTLIDADLHAPLAMAMVITRQGGDKPEASHFRDFLQSATARDILGRYGFEAPGRD